jgi:hypothetical protein
MTFSLKFQQSYRLKGLHAFSIICSNYKTKILRNGKKLQNNDGQISENSNLCFTKTKSFMSVQTNVTSIDFSIFFMFHSIIGRKYNYLLTEISIRGIFASISATVICNSALIERLNNSGIIYMCSIVYTSSSRFFDRVLIILFDFSCSIQQYNMLKSSWTRNATHMRHIQTLIILIVIPRGDA